MPFFTNNLPRDNIQNTWTATQFFDDIHLSDGSNISINATTGSKIGTGVLQKIGFWNVTPVIQPGHIADPTGGAVIDIEARAVIDLILADSAEIGIQAAS